MPTTSVKKSTAKPRTPRKRTTTKRTAAEPSSSVSMAHAIDALAVLVVNCYSQTPQQTAQRIQERSQADTWILPTWTPIREAYTTVVEYAQAGGTLPEMVEPSVRDLFEAIKTG